MPSKLDMELLFGIIHQDVKVRGKKKDQKKREKRRIDNNFDTNYLDYIPHTLSKHRG